MVRYVDSDAAALYLNERGFRMKPQTLAKWRCHGTNDLPYYKVGGSVRYDTDDLDAMIENSKVMPGLSYSA